MSPQIQPLPVSQSTSEGVSTLYSISWEQFKTIDALLADRQGVKLSFLQGMLEIMSPICPEHENIKRNPDQYDAVTDLIQAIRRDEL